MCPWLYYSAEICKQAHGKFTGLFEIFLRKCYKHAQYKNYTAETVTVVFIQTTRSLSNNIKLLMLTF